MEVIEGRTAAFLDLQAETGVKRLLAGAANPEVAATGFAHLNHALFHDTRTYHEAMNPEAARRGQGFVSAGDLRHEQGYLAAVTERLLARHASSSSECRRSAGLR